MPGLIKVSLILFLFAETPSTVAADGLPPLNGITCFGNKEQTKKALIDMINQMECKKSSNILDCMNGIHALSVAAGVAGLSAVAINLRSRLVSSCRGGTASINLFLSEAYAAGACNINEVMFRKEAERYVDDATKFLDGEISKATVTLRTEVADQMRNAIRAENQVKNLETIRESLRTNPNQYFRHLESSLLKTPPTRDIQELAAKKMAAIDKVLKGLDGMPLEKRAGYLAEQGYEVSKGLSMNVADDLQAGWDRALKDFKDPEVRALSKALTEGRIDEAEKLAANLSRKGVRGVSMISTHIARIKDLRTSRAAFSETQSWFRQLARQVRPASVFEQASRLSRLPHFLPVEREARKAFEQRMASLTALAYHAERTEGAAALNVSRAAASKEVRAEGAALGAMARKTGFRALGWASKIFTGPFGTIAAVAEEVAGSPAAPKCEGFPDGGYSFATEQEDGSCKISADYNAGLTQDFLYIVFEDQMEELERHPRFCNSLKELSGQYSPTSWKGECIPGGVRMTSRDTTRTPNRTFYIDTNNDGTLKQFRQITPGNNYFTFAFPLTSEGEIKEMLYRSPNKGHSTEPDVSFDTRTSLRVNRETLFSSENLSKQLAGYQEVIKPLTDIVNCCSPNNSDKSNCGLYGAIPKPTSGSGRANQ